MSTMYVSNIQPGYTVNLRKEPNSSAVVLVRVGYGKAVEATKYNSTWHKATYSSYTGYIMSKFLSSTNPNGSSSGGSGNNSSSASAIGVITGDQVRVRSQPNTSSNVLTHVNKGDKVTYYPNESYSSSSHKWYRCTSSKWSGNGYIAADYVQKDDGSSSGGGTNSGSSNDFTDIVTTNPTVTTYYAFNPQNAVAYALTHSTTMSDTVADPARNKSFGEGSSNNCANFVHQCLIAGGARMFNGWCYKLPGIPSSWDSSSWKYTNQGRRSLLEKKWIELIPITSVKAGDIIYSYFSDYKDRGFNTPYNHVTIAVTDYDAAINGCRVCGHSKNQNNVIKELKDSGNPCTYCYRMKSRLGGDGTEKSIDLTDGNSKAI